MTEYYIYMTFYSTIKAETEEEAKNKLSNIMDSLEGSNDIEYHGSDEMNVLCRTMADGSVIENKEEDRPIIEYRESRTWIITVGDSNTVFENKERTGTYKQIDEYVLSYFDETEILLQDYCNDTQISYMQFNSDGQTDLFVTAKPKQSGVDQ